MKRKYILSLIAIAIVVVLSGVLLYVKYYSNEYYYFNNTISTNDYSFVYNSSDNVVSISLLETSNNVYTKCSYNLLFEIDKEYNDYEKLDFGNEKLSWHITNGKRQTKILSDEIYTYSAIRSSVNEYGYKLPENVDYNFILSNVKCEVEGIKIDNDLSLSQNSFNFGSVIPLVITYNGNVNNVLIDDIVLSKDKYDIKNGSVTIYNTTLDEFANGEHVVSVASLDSISKGVISMHNVPTLSTTIISLEGSHTSSSGDVWKVVHETFLDSMNNTVDAGYRYEGKNPDNFLYYSGRLYRIIGTFKGSTINLNAPDYYTKIVSVDSLDLYNEDVLNYRGDWINSSLYTKLNTEYYSSFENNIFVSNARWYLNDLYSLNLNVYNVYLYERGDYSSYVDQRIGLMYPSDYMYASMEEDCNRYTNLIDYKTCSNNFLLSDYSEYLITSKNNVSYKLSKGIIDSSWKENLVIRPALYLNNDLRIKSGDGTINNPYTVK